MKFLIKLFKNKVGPILEGKDLPALADQDRALYSTSPQVFPKPYLTNMVTYGGREDSVYFVDE